MRSVDLIVESPVSTSMRARQVCAMFDVPAQTKARLSWKGAIDIDGDDWNVGIIVGPSGSGKSSIMRHLWGDMPSFRWESMSVIDDFAATHSVEAIAEMCGAVGFNTIPAWLRPFSVLSNGEQFRVDLARRLLELPDPIVVDEFTSVVDRQVAKIGSHAVAKAVRRNKRKFIAVTCHYDIIDWLQPDWVLEPATMSFSRRSLQPRPKIVVDIRRCDYATWAMFASYHYLTADLNKSARCFALYVNNQPVAFAGMVHFPHPTVDDIMRCSRLVTLPDWQGLGLSMALVDQCAMAYKALGKRLRTYPAHFALIRTFDRSPRWRLITKPGYKKNTPGPNRMTDAKNKSKFGHRPNAVFSFVGEAMDRDAARLFVGGGS